MTEHNDAHRPQPSDNVARQSGVTDSRGWTLESAQLALNELPFGLGLIGADGRVIAATKGVSRYLPVKPEDIIGQHFEQFMPAILADVYVPILNKAVKTGQIQTIEGPGWIDGRGGWLNWQARPLADKDGKIRYVLCYAEEITQRRMDEMERIRQSENFWRVQKNQSVAMLAAGVAHDFNNLLVSILGNATLMQEDLDLGAEHNEMLSEIVDSARQAASLTRQLLAYARGGEFNPAPMCIDVACAHALRLAHTLVKNRIKVHLDTRTRNMWIAGDSVQIQQALINLLVNASEASESGQEVTVQIQRIDCPHNHTYGSDTCVEIVVIDNGSGMDQVTRDKMFDPFFSTKDFGRGLGLPAVLGIVDVHGGDIDIDSQPGAGTRVSIKLPEITAPDQVSGRTVANPPPGGSGTFRLDVGDDVEPDGLADSNWWYTVVVYIADLRVRQWCVDQLESHGCKCLAAETESQVEHYLSEPHGSSDADYGGSELVILTDLAIASPSVGRIWETASKLPMVVITAADRVADGVVSQWFSRVEYVGRPLTPGRLLQALERVTGESTGTAEQ